MSPELETLDQWLVGDLPLHVIHRLYPDDERFVRGLSGLLRAGEVRLVASDGAVLALRQWQSVLTAINDNEGVRVAISDAGARRVM